MSKQITFTAVLTTVQTAKMTFVPNDDAPADTIEKVKALLATPHEMHDEIWRAMQENKAIMIGDDDESIGQIVVDESDQGDGEVEVTDIAVDDDDAEDDEASDEE